MEIEHQLVDEFEEPFGDKDKPFAIETLMLLREQFERTEHSLESKPLRDFKLVPKDKSRDISVRPSWPYQHWFSNVHFEVKDRLADSIRKDRPDINKTCSGESKITAQPGTCFFEEEKSEGCTKSKTSNENEGAILCGLLDKLNMEVSNLDTLLNSLFGTENTLKEDSESNLKTKTLPVVDKQTNYFPTDESVAEPEKTIDETAGSRREKTDRTADANTQIPNVENACVETANSAVGIALHEDPYFSGENTQDVKRSLETSTEFVTNLTASFKNEGYRGSRNKQTDIPKGQTDILNAMVHSDQKPKNIRVDRTHYKKEQIIETALAKPDTPSHMTRNYKVPVMTNSAWWNLISHWISFICLQESDALTYIKDTVYRIITDTLDDLKSKYRIFSASYIIATGSMAENTRIIKPDEFDFMIAVPALADPAVTQLCYSQMGIQVTAHESQEEELFQFLDDWNPSRKKLGQPLTTAVLLEIFRSSVPKHLLDGWEYLPESMNHSMRVFLKNQTGTFHLLCNTREYRDLQISVDVCFCLPLETENIDNIRVVEFWEAEGLFHLQKQCNRLGSPMFAVLNANPLVCGRCYFLCEQDMFRNNDVHANCYRLAKYVVRIFLPKIQKNKCPLCVDSIIPSFYLKTIMYYLMENYTDPHKCVSSHL